MLRHTPVASGIHAMGERDPGRAEGGAVAMRAMEGWCVIGSSEGGGDGGMDDFGESVMHSGIGWGDGFGVLECLVCGLEVKYLRSTGSYLLGVQP